MPFALGFAFIYAIVAAAAVVLFTQPVWTMILPPAICALPLLALLTRRPAVVDRARIAALVLLALFIMLGLMTVGALFVPSFIALVIAQMQADKAVRVVES
jgi:hypothetical protein